MIFHSEGKVYTVENDQIKYFVQNFLVKITFVFVQTTSCFATTAMSYVSLSLWSLSKEFCIIQEAAGYWFVLDYERPPHQIKYIL